MLLPLFDRVIYPHLDKRGYNLNLRVRIIIGMLFSMLAVGLAGVLEMYRLKVYWKDGVQHPHIQKIGKIVVKVISRQFMVWAGSSYWAY